MSFDRQRILPSQLTPRRQLAARHVFTLSASNGEGRGEVSISVGFNGPIMVEGVKVGATAEETTANARANREFLGKALGSV